MSDTIISVKPPSPYILVERGHLQSTKLSLAAKGMIAVLEATMVAPHYLSTADIYRACCSENTQASAIDEAIAELIAFNYLPQSQIKDESKC